MSRRPLISVVVPCHNDAALLGWALASVIAQSVDDWECIVVDDGSVDRPEEVVAVFDDPRFRLITLNHNSGRAAARQVALDAARGAYLAKVDADDWIYPAKLAHQWDVLQQLSDVALVSAGIAIEDERGRIAGVRARGPRDDLCSMPPLTRISPPPIAHAPSMIRMEVAKRYRYNQCLSRSEDADYLLKILMKHRYTTLHEVLYAYREYHSGGQRDILDAYRARMKMFWMVRHRFPLAAARRTGETALKWVAYRAAFLTGHADKLIASRSSIPSEQDVRVFEDAKSQVTRVYTDYFCGSEPAPASVGKR